MQKSHFSLFFALILCVTIALPKLAFAQTTYPINPNLDIFKYTFEIGLNDTSNVINGEATIEFSLKDQNELTLDLIGLAVTGEGMVVSDITSGDSSLSFEHEQDRLIIDLELLNNKSSTYEIKIFYQGEAAAGLIIGKSKFGDRVFFGDNYPDRARNWLPCIDHPSDKATVKWIITAPDHYKVVASGRFISEVQSGENLVITTWEEQVPISTKVMTFGAANFAIDHSGDINDVPVTTWVYQQNKEDGFHDFAIAPKVLAYYDSLIGPYPYEKLANVQSKTTYGGMENASNIFYFENAVNGLAEQEGLIAHEIVHQWFGNSATEKDWPHAWLSEGFATYLTHVYKGSRYGREEMNKGLKADRDRVINYWHQNPLPIVNYDLVSFPRVSGPLLSANTYQKGGWVLHMLRNELGDEVFWQAIRRYYADYRDSNASTDDFQKVVERVSGKDLQHFFNQWLYGEGQPFLMGDWQYDDNTITVKLSQVQKPGFTFPLEIGLVYDDEIIIKSVNINTANNSFTFSSPRPLRVILDPNTRLLFEGDEILPNH